MDSDGNERRDRRYQGVYEVDRGFGSQARDHHGEEGHAAAGEPEHPRASRCADTPYRTDQRCDQKDDHARFDKAHPRRRDTDQIPDDQ